MKESTRRIKFDVNRGYSKVHILETKFINGVISEDTYLESIRFLRHDIRGLLVFAETPTAEKFIKTLIERCDNILK